MQEFLTDTFGVEVIRWAEPTEDGELYEVIHRGRVIRADSLALVLAAVREGVPQRPRLAWTNVVAGTIVMPLSYAA